MKLKRKAKLTTIIVTSFVTVFALFILGISLLSYNIFFDFTSEEISTARLALLNENTQKVSNLNAGISEAAAYIAANKTVIETFSEPVESDYDAIEEQRDFEDLLNVVAGLKKTAIDSIELYTDRYDGYPRIGGGVIFPLEELREEAWFRMFDAMDNGWIPTHASRSGRSIISYVNRLSDHRGNTVGYVKVNVVDETFFSYLTDDVMFNPAQDPLLVLDSGGRVITRQGPAHAEGAIADITRPLPQQASYSGLTERYARLHNHHEVLKHGNELYLLLISEPNYERWRLVQLIQIDALYAKTRELGWLVLMLGLAGLLLSVPLAYWVGKRIIGPIRTIIQGMRAAERGRFDARLGTHFIEEYDVLARNFNHMIAELDRSLKQTKAENKARRDAELRTLQNQITPHFLYNTLDVIHWKAMDHGAEEISHMVNLLSKMFRIGLSGGKTFITLRDELEHAKSYVEIQQIRLDRSIRYNVQVPAGIKEYCVPKIVLQPFIENSMRHGYPDGCQGPIEIRVGARIVTSGGRDSLELAIEDNGAGLPDGWTPDMAQGIGIRNVQERIWMYCGAGYGVELRNRPEGGVAVRMRLLAIASESDARLWLEHEPERP